MQFMFGRDAILSILYQEDWKYIRDKNLRLINMNNKRENVHKISHTYQPNDIIILLKQERTKHGEREYNFSHLV